MRGVTGLEDHGYVATDLALEDLLAERAAARGGAGAATEPGSPAGPCEYLIVTNGDNLYGRHYLSAVLAEVATGGEMVDTHWVSHYEMQEAWTLQWGEVSTVGGT